MSSPFPGMDPYLEAPRYWRGFHGLLLGALTLELNAHLPDAFVARMDQRLYIVPWQRNIYPDSAVLLEGRLPPGSGATATLEKPQTMKRSPLIFTLESEPVRESFIEIVTADSPGEVVTVIELLSPSNKEPEGVGRDEYLRKQRAVFASEAHLLEIDLLRGGLHTVAIPRPLLQARGPFDYVYCLHRSGTGPRLECWPFTLRETMPPLYVPLIEGESDLEIDFQAVFSRVYDGGRYGRSIDYQAQPETPLAVEDAAWTDNLLRRAGLRP